MILFTFLIKSKISSWQSFFEGTSSFESIYLNIKAKRGPHRTMDSILASHPAAPGLILGISKNFFLDVAEIY